MPSNFWDTYYGGGYGVGQGGVGQGQPESMYTPPRDATQPSQQNNAVAQGGGSGFDAALDWARLGYAVYKDQNPRKPKFEAVPLSPEQKQLWDLYLKSMMNPALKNNAAQVNQNASEILRGYSNLKWESPALPGQERGYTSSTPITPFMNEAPPAGPQKTASGLNIAPGGLKFGNNANLVQHRVAEDGLGSGMGVMDEIAGLSAGLFNDPMNQIHAGNATGDPNWAPTPWPEGTGPNAQRGTPVPQGGKPGDNPLNDPSIHARTGGDPTNNPAFTGFVDFLTSQGVKDAAHVAFALFSGGLPAAGVAAARALWNAYQRSKGGKP